MNDHRVVVVGSATRSVEPDHATLSLRVKEVDDDQRLAFERCVPRMNELVANLSDVVGAGGRVTANEVRVHRDWDEFAEERQQVRQAATATVVVECPPELAAKVVTEAMALGVDEVGGLRYSRKDPAPLLESLLDDAVIAARRKATRLAEAAGRSLGAVRLVEEEASRHWDDGNEVVELVSRSSDDGLALQPGELEFRVAVRVAFALTDA